MRKKARERDSDTLCPNVYRESARERERERERDSDTLYLNVYRESEINYGKSTSSMKKQYIYIHIYICMYVHIYT